MESKREKEEKATKQKPWWRKPRQRREDNLSIVVGTSPSSTDPSLAEPNQSGENNISGVEIAEIGSAKRKRRLTSLVWNDFEKIKKNGVDVAVCKNCKKELSGSSSSGTTHLKNHTIRCPGKYSGDMRQMRLLTCGKKKERTAYPGGFQYDERKSRLELVRMIIYHEYPFDIVEHVGFRRFIQSLCPFFNMMSHNDIKNDCMVFYEKEKKRIYDALDKIFSRVNLSMELWTTYQGVVCLCLTAHYIDVDWKLQRRIINFLRLGEHQTGEALANTVMECITDWDIDKGLFAFTLGDCSTNDVAIGEIKHRLFQNKSLLDDGKFFHVQCVGQMINGIVQDGMQKLNMVIENVQESIKFVRSSQQHQQLFEEVVQHIHLSSQRTLSFDVTMDWISVYPMLQAALEYKDAFIQLSSRDPEYTKLPSEEQWEQASTFCSLLKHCNEVVKFIAVSEHPTVNLVFEFLCEIHILLVEWNNSFDEVIRSMAPAMKVKFDRYWEKCHMILAVASFLDPQYKMKLMECYYPQIFGSDAEDRVKEILDIVKSLYEVYASNMASSLDNCNGHAAESIGSGGSSGTPCQSSSGDGREVRRFDRFLQENIQTQRLKSDLDYYLEEDVFPRDSENSNLLNWWKIHAAKYPVLSKMAHDILGIPISIVAPEAAFSFSTGARMLDAYRSLLDAEITQALICMQDWLKDEMGESVSSLADCMFPPMMDMATPCHTLTSMDMD